MKRLLIALAATLFAAGVVVALFGFYVMFAAGLDLLFLSLWFPVTGFLLSLPFVIAWIRRTARVQRIGCARHSGVAGVYFISLLGSLPMS